MYFNKADKAVKAKTINSHQTLTETDDRMEHAMTYKIK